jgi:hypothetical protein
MSPRRRFSSRVPGYSLAPKGTRECRARHPQQHVKCTRVSGHPGSHKALLWANRPATEWSRR